MENESRASYKVNWSWERNCGDQLPLHYAFFMLSQAQRR